MTNTALRVISVTGVAGGRWSYVAPTVYEARVRADGRKTFHPIAWPLGSFLRNGHRLLRGYRSQKAAVCEAKALAEKMGIEYRPGVRYGTPV